MFTRGQHVIYQQNENYLPSLALVTRTEEQNGSPQLHPDICMPGAIDYVRELDPGHVDLLVYELPGPRQFNNVSPELIREVD